MTMDRLRQDLFADAGLALDEDANILLRDELHLVITWVMATRWLTKVG